MHVSHCFNFNNLKNLKLFSYNFHWDSEDYNYYFLFLIYFINVDSLLFKHWSNLSY